MVCRQYSVWTLYAAVVSTDDIGLADFGCSSEEEEEDSNDGSVDEGGVLTPARPALGDIPKHVPVKCNELNGLFALESDVVLCQCNSCRECGPTDASGPFSVADANLLATLSTGWPPTTMVYQVLVPSA